MFSLMTKRFGDGSAGRMTFDDDDFGGDIRRETRVAAGGADGAVGNGGGAGIGAGGGADG